MKDLGNVNLPSSLTIDSLERNTIGETNEVFFCIGAFEGRPVSAYVKVSKHPNLSLSNERAVLQILAETDVPVPAVLWYGEAERDVLITEALPGRMIWDWIDPRRGTYDKPQALKYLVAYGEWLARIHGLAIPWPGQVR